MLPAESVTPVVDVAPPEPLLSALMHTTMNSPTLIVAVVVTASDAEDAVELPVPAGAAVIAISHRSDAYLVDAPARDRTG